MTTLTDMYFNFRIPKIGVGECTKSLQNKSVVLNKLERFPAPIKRSHALKSLIETLRFRLQLLRCTLHCGKLIFF